MVTATTAAASLALPARFTARPQAALLPLPAPRAGGGRARRAGLAVLAYRVEDSPAPADAPPAEDAPFTGPPLPAVQAPTIDAQGFLSLENAAEPPPLDVARQIFEAGASVGCFQASGWGEAGGGVRCAGTAQQARQLAVHVTWQLRRRLRLCGSAPALPPLPLHLAAPPLPRSWSTTA